MLLKESAGWNQTARDWERLLHLAPSTCWGIFDEATLAATATVYARPDGVAWIGMVLTLPAYRGRGLATCLLERALAIPFPCFRLDATAQGAPLYRKLGFTEERAIERWRRQAPRAPAVPPPPPAGPGWGYPASLVAALTEESAAFPGTFALVRAGSGPAYFGPCLGPALGDALAWAASRHDDLYWDLFPDDAEAVAAARAFGFEPVRELVRMRRGEPLADPAGVRAICGFEFG